MTQTTAGPAPSVLVRETLAIEYLRRQYAKATDLLGTGEAQAVAEGTRIYHDIFSVDASIGTSGEGVDPYAAVGPDAWADVVIDALAEYSATQHLIGTQLVELQTLTCDANNKVASGSAVMTSYLQAWHSTANEVWLFIGTYTDIVKYTPNVGWQIVDMDLARVAEEKRTLGGSL